MLQNKPSRLGVDLHFVKAILAAIKTQPKPETMPLHEQQRLRTAFDEMLRKVEYEPETFEELRIDVLEHIPSIKQNAECLVGAVLLAERVKEMDFELEGSSSGTKKPEKPDKRVSEIEEQQVSDIKRQIPDLKKAVLTASRLFEGQLVDIDVILDCFCKYSTIMQANSEEEAKKIKQLKKKDSESNRIEEELADLRKSEKEITTTKIEMESENSRLREANSFLEQQLNDLESRLRLQEEQQSDYVENGEDAMERFELLEEQILSAKSQVAQIGAEKEHLAANIKLAAQREEMCEQAIAELKDRLQEKEVESKYKAGELKLLNEQNHKLKELIEYYQNKERLSQYGQPEQEKTQHLNSMVHQYQSLSDDDQDSLDDSMTQLGPKRNFDEMILQKIDSISEERQQLERQRIKIQVMQTELEELREENSGLKAKLDRSETSENLLIEENERIVALELENNELKQTNSELKGRCKSQESKIAKMGAELEVLRRFVK